MAFPLIPLLVQLAVTVTLMVIAYIIMPKPKPQKPEVRDLQNPTADAGRPIPVVFGTKTVKGVNVLWYGEKTTHQYKVKV